LTLREGEARGDIEDLRSSGSVRLTMDASSYSSNFGLRDEDVRDNYLEVKEYPLITFTSTGVEQIRDFKLIGGTWQFTIKGILELHGIKRAISVPVKLTYREGKITAEGSTKILLKDFNLAVPTLLFRFRSGDQVEVRFRIVGERRS